MILFLKSFQRIFCVFFLVCVLGACSSGLTAGLEAFQSTDGRYGFFYPTGWTRVQLEGGPEVVFHDLINSEETLSLVISNVGDDTDVSRIGSPEEVGKRLIEEFIAPSGGSRTAELIDATSRDTQDHVFYDIEYLIHLSDRDRHELATVVIDKGSLFTLAVGTNEYRWERVEPLFRKVLSSLSFFV